MKMSEFLQAWLPWKKSRAATNKLKFSGESVAVCAIMKNEADNLLEWIAYHHAIGVERFFLYDNASTDNTREILRPLIECGIVEYHWWDVVPGQIPAYEDCAIRTLGKWDWVAFIDIDEFLHIFDRSTIQTFLARFADCGAVVLQWLNFGPSGHEERPNGFQMVNYIYRLPWQADVHRLVKTLLRPDAFVGGNNPHSFRVKGKVVDERGVDVVQGELLYSEQPPHDPEFACINHYYTRSRADYLLKLARGCADDVNAVRELAWFEDYANNANVRDERILSRMDGTKSVLQNFQKLGCNIDSLIEREYW